MVIALVLVGAFALGAVVIAAPRSGDESSPRTPRRFEGSTLPAGLRAPDFALRDQDGGRVTMRELRGRPAIVTFLYTTCEDTCPTQVQQIKGALGELGEDIPAVAVAVDPPRDTPESARAFLSKQRMTGRMDFALGLAGGAGASVEGLLRPAPAR